MSNENTRVPTTVQEVDMGVNVSKYPIERYKASEKRIDLISVLTERPIVTQTVFHDKIGYRFHANPASDAVGLEPTTHYNFLVALWNGDAQGKSIVDLTYEIMVLSLSQRNYERLTKIFNLNGDLRKLVLQVQAEDEKYQSMSFGVYAPQQLSPPYMSNKGLMDAIKNDVIAFKPFVWRVIGGLVEESKFKELWNKEGTAIENAASDAKFGNRGMVGGGAVRQQLPENNITDVSFEETAGSGVQAGTGQVAINQGRAAGTLKSQDFDFTDKQAIAGSGTAPVQQGRRQPVQTQPANTAAEATNNITQGADKSKEFFNSSEDFTFEEQK